MDFLRNDDLVLQKLKKKPTQWLEGPILREALTRKRIAEMQSSVREANVIRFIRSYWNMPSIGDFYSMMYQLELSELIESRCSIAEGTDIKIRSYRLTQGTHRKMDTVLSMPSRIAFG